MLRMQTTKEEQHSTLPRAGETLTWVPAILPCSPLF